MPQVSLDEPTFTNTFIKCIFTMISRLVAIAFVARHEVVLVQSFIIDSFVYLRCLDETLRRSGGIYYIYGVGPLCVDIHFAIIGSRSHCL
jgi:hypothetical protein